MQANTTDNERINTLINKIDHQHLSNNVSFDNLICKKTLRLGKLNKDRPRPIKVIFNNEDVARNILPLKHEVTINTNVRISSDIMPAQKAYLDTLRTALKEKIDNGNKDLTIRYINGTLKITNKSAHQSKN